MKFYDISPLISPRLAVFPGDQSFQHQVSLDFAKGDHLKLSAITGTLHLGSHADAPSHYAPGGADIASSDLRPYLGPAQVIQIDLPPFERILPQHLQVQALLAKRVLFSTGSYRPDEWNNHFNSLSPELIEFLHKQQVRLVGIDTPSVDPADSKLLESHQALAKTGMAVLEGLVLDDVPQGLYNLIALPLKLEGGEASPVRAILLDPEVDLSRL